MARWLRRLALILLAAVLTLAALTLHTLAEGERAMERSEAAFDAGDLRESILHARRAATLHAPGAQHERAAYDRLAAIAVGAEATGNRDVAIEAWSAIRAAALESRNVVSPREEELSRANHNLARLAAKQPSRGAALARLSKDRAPGARWILLLGAGFALLGAGVGLFVARGVTKEGRFSPRVVRWAAVLSVLGAACWTIAVIRA